MVWNRPKLTVAQILAWADEHHVRTGRWPSVLSGPIPGAPGEMWVYVNQALWAGRRGLPGGDTLAGLLARKRGTTPRRRSSLTVGQILEWADAYHERTGKWPTLSSGPIPEAPGEDWYAIHHTLSDGNRGLPPGDSLPRLLKRHRRRRGRKQGKGRAQE